MCGIAGWLGASNRPHKRADILAQALHHRGPDGSAAHVTAQLGLVHTRLKIIDLSARGDQPLWSHDRRVATIINGEIYNHTALRKALAAKGHTFSSDSDCAVIPALYAEYGDDFVTHLQGIFAGALWDTRHRKLLLFRDRFGTKPLFYAHTPQGLFFASEMGALLKLPEVGQALDTQALYDYAALGYIAAPRTMYLAIANLEPGFILTAHEGKGAPQLRRYHQFASQQRPSISAEEAVETAEHLLKTAIQQQSQSDVAKAYLLSGGIDSSLICHLATQQEAAPIDTYSVGFFESAYDESQDAAEVARLLGSRHHLLSIQPRSGDFDDIAAIFLAMGQPFADTSLLPAHAVSRLVSQQARVLFAGDGGDEAFGGYQMYQRLSAIGLIVRHPLIMKSAARLHQAWSSHLPIWPQQLDRRIQQALAMHSESQEALISRFFTRLSHDEQSQLFFSSGRYESTHRLFKKAWPQSSQHREDSFEGLFAHMNEANVRLALAGDFLPKIDMAGMAYGVETRVPFLDEALFDFGLSLPASFKVRGTQTKALLRKLAARHFPAAIARKKKMGFGIPFDTWVSDAFKQRLAEQLLSPRCVLNELLNPAIYRPMVQSFLQGRQVANRKGAYQNVAMLFSLFLHLQKTLK